MYIYIYIYIYVYIHIYIYANHYSGVYHNQPIWWFLMLLDSLANLVVRFSDKMSYARYVSWLYIAYYRNCVRYNITRSYDRFTVQLVYDPTKNNWIVMYSALPYQSCSI